MNDLLTHNNFATGVHEGLTVNLVHEVTVTGACGRACCICVRRRCTGLWAVDRGIGAGGQIIIYVVICTRDTRRASCVNTDRRKYSDHYKRKQKS